MTRIVGIDLSLTSTGFASIEDNEFGGHNISVRRIQSKGSAGASLPDRQARLHKLRLAVCTLAEGADLVVIEGPAFSRSNPGMHDRSGLWWMVVDWLAGGGFDGFPAPVAEVSPSCRAKYATGKGNAGKDQVLAAVVRRYSDVDVTGNDEADALILAAMGARHLCIPVEDLPKLNLAAMDAVRWPELKAVA